MLDAAPLHSVEARDRLIVALDLPSAAQARDLAVRLSRTCRWMKVGLELYLSAGNAIIEELAGMGFSIFLDLKFHDIPNTVAGAVRSAASCGVSLLTVHAAGGPAMLTAAREAAENAENAPEILAVTVLTSMDAAELHAIGVGVSPAEQVSGLARMAQSCGIAGLVCSAQEIRLLRRQIGQNMRLVVPGIRPAGADVGDQKRIATPADAIQAGANMLVIGRPITRASDPAQAAESILTQMGRAIAG